MYGVPACTVGDPTPQVDHLAAADVHAGGARPPRRAPRSWRGTRPRPPRTPARPSLRSPSCHPPRSTMPGQRRSGCTSWCNIRRAATTTLRRSVLHGEHEEEEADRRRGHRRSDRRCRRCGPGAARSRPRPSPRAIDTSMHTHARRPGGAPWPGGPTSSPNTSRLPAAVNDDTTATAMSASRQTCATRGRRPRLAALPSLNDEREERAVARRRVATTTTSAAIACTAMSPQSVWAMSPNRSSSTASCVGGGEHDEPDREHAHEQQPDAGVVAQRSPPIHDADARDQHRGAEPRRRASGRRPTPARRPRRGSRACASASPRKVRPRSTTQVPTSEQATTASIPATSAWSISSGSTPALESWSRVRMCADDMENGYHSQINAVTATDLDLAYGGADRGGAGHLHHPRARRSPR